jgi:uncharacterized membrane-anchored protein
MNIQILFGTVLQPNVDGFLPFLPAIAIMLAIVVATFLKPVVVSIASPAAVAPINLKVGAVMMAQVILLLGFAAKHEMVIRSGTEITIAIHPYDPIDIFRGNYLRFRTDISELSSENTQFKNAKPFVVGDVVYVVLESSEPQWKPVAVYDYFPVVELNQVVLKGIYKSGYGKTMNIHYGLEQYFYPDGKKIQINKTSMMKAKVDKNGDAVLTELIP